MDDGNADNVGSVREILPGFASLGFRIPPDGTRLGRLLEGAAAVSESYPAAVGEALLCSGDYYRLWQNFDLEDSQPVLECSPLPGMVAFVDSPQTGARIKAWLVDREDPDASKPLPVCFTSPHFLLGTPPRVNELCPLSLTMLAGSCLVFDSAEALAADPRTQGWPTPSFAATGMFDAEGNELAEPKTAAFLTGKVILGVKAENDLTSSHYWALRVRTQFGEVFVCLPVEALDEDPWGKVIAVAGKMSGSFPQFVPAPTTVPKADSESGFDNEAVEERIRQLTVAFMESEEFTPVFHEIHPDKFAQRLATGIGLFNKDFREAAKNLAGNRQLATPELRQRYLEVARTAPIVFAHVVMANTLMIDSGKSSPALVVLAWDEKGMEIMGKASSMLSRVHFDIPENEEERQLAALIEDEEYHFGRRRRLPDWLVEGHEAYAADLWVSGAALDHERIRMEVIVCFAERGPNGLTMAIPGKFIKQALHEMSPSPAPPPLPASTSPPPLPGRNTPPPLPHT